MSEHRLQSRPPTDAVCIDDGCNFPATVTRPSDVWLHDDGVIFDADEWVCALHQERRLCLNCGRPEGDHDCIEPTS